MDTKLKNKHRLGIFITWLLIIGAAAGMVSAYPYIWQRAAYWKEQRQESEMEYTRQNMVENLAVQAQFAGYAMWLEEAQEQQGRKLRPSQVFVPELEDLLENTIIVQIRDESSDSQEAVCEEGSFYMDTGLLEEIRGYIDARGDSWKEALGTMGGVQNTRVSDENGRVISGENPPLNEENQVRIRIFFDQMGRCTYDGAEGNPEGVRSLEENKGIFNQVLEGEDPIASQYGSDYVYYGILFSGPQYRRYEFTIDKEKVLGYTPEGREAINFYTLRNSGMFLLIWTGLALLLGLAALLLPLLPVISLGTGKVSRASLGVVGLALFADAFVVLYGGELIVETVNGNLERVLAEAFGFGRWPEILRIVNGIYWAITFGVVFWAALCLRAVFTLGPWRYFKERTITGWFCRILARGCRFARRKGLRFWNSVCRIDWQEQSVKTILKLVMVNFAILTIICMLWFWGIFVLIPYSVALFIVLKRYSDNFNKKYQVLLGAIGDMADGNLDVEVEEDLGIFAPFYHQLTRIRNGFKKAVQEEVKSQRMKTELVTNVSHDLKTPLTAIITYINLLKKEDITEEERHNYIQVLEAKSMRLKALIEDLFEVSKATSGNTPLELVDVDIVSLLKQVHLELGDRMETSGIDFRWNLPEEKVILKLDSQKTYRVFENLLVNILKYAMPGTRAYIDVLAEGKAVTISMKNISAAELTVNPAELTERFVRGDAARNTEGSGLGLAIAKSFVELQGGRMEIDVEADLFRVVIHW